MNLTARGKKSGWERRVEFEEGIKKKIEYFEKPLNVEGLNR